MLEKPKTPSSSKPSNSEAILYSKVDKIINLLVVLKVIRSSYGANPCMNFNSHFMPKPKFAVPPLRFCLSFQEHTCTLPKDQSNKTLQKTRMFQQFRLTQEA